KAKWTSDKDRMRALIGPYISEIWYRKTYNYSGPDVTGHYIDSGWKKNNPNPYFDKQWYETRHKNASEGDTNPLVQYIKFGEDKGHTPSARFDPQWYREEYPDIVEAGLSPLLHYLSCGLTEGRLPILHAD